MSNYWGRCGCNHTQIIVGYTVKLLGGYISHPSRVSAPLNADIFLLNKNARKYNYQRWSPQGRPWPRGRPREHILKSLVSKIKSLALRPQVLENWPLGSRTAVFFELLKFCGALEKFFWKTFFCGDRLKNFCEDFFFVGDRLKNFCEDLFFGKHLRLCPWSLALASSIPVLGLESVCPRKGCPWP